MTDRNLTTVLIEYRKNRSNHRLLFGKPILRIRRGWRRELAVFEPGQIFGYERWRANHYGTQDWRIAVCRAVKAGSITKFPGISPGVIILLDTSGKTRAKQALSLFDQLKTQTQNPLEMLPEARWRLIGNAIETGASDTLMEMMNA